MKWRTVTDLDIAADVAACERSKRPVYQMPQLCERTTDGVWHPVETAASGETVTRIAIHEGAPFVWPAHYEYEPWRTPYGWVWPHTPNVLRAHGDTTHYASPNQSRN